MASPLGAAGSCEPLIQSELHMTDISDDVASPLGVADGHEATLYKAACLSAMVTKQNYLEDKLPWQPQLTSQDQPMSSKEIAQLQLITDQKENSALQGHPDLRALESADSIARKLFGSEKEQQLI